MYYYYYTNCIFCPTHSDGGWEAGWDCPACSLAAPDNASSTPRPAPGAGSSASSGSNRGGITRSARKPSVYHGFGSDGGTDGFQTKQLQLLHCVLAGKGNPIERA